MQTSLGLLLPNKATIDHPANWDDSNKTQSNMANVVHSVFM